MNLWFCGRNDWCSAAILSEAVLSDSGLSAKISSFTLEYRIKKLYYNSCLDSTCTRITITWNPSIILELKKNYCLKKKKKKKKMPNIAKWTWSFNTFVGKIRTLSQSGQESALWSEMKWGWWSLVQTIFSYFRPRKRVCALKLVMTVHYAQYHSWDCIYSLVIGRVASVNCSDWISRTRWGKVDTPGCLECEVKRFAVYLP